MTIQHEPGTGFEVETEVVWSRVIGVLLAFGLLIVGIYWLFGGEEPELVEQDTTAESSVAPTSGAESTLQTVPDNADQRQAEADSPGVPTQAPELVATVPLPTASATTAPAPTAGQPSLAPTAGGAATIAPTAAPRVPEMTSKPEMNSSAKHNAKRAFSSSRNTATANESAGSGEGKHTVLVNETLKSIAQQVYGDQQKWLYLAQANPRVKPNALPVGAQLIVPDVAKLVHKRQQQWSDLSGSLRKPGAGPQKVVVHPNENLYVIAERAYGNPELWTRIAKANRDKVPDPQHVDVGTILLIPPLKH